MQHSTTIPTRGATIALQAETALLWLILRRLLGAALLLGGGLSSIQALALATAFPFVLIMMMMMVSLFLGLRAERVLLERGEAEP